jgi:peptidoglycan hydrolase CwlO-like protein
MLSSKDYPIIVINTITSFIIYNYFNGFFKTQVEQDKYDYLLNKIHKLEKKVYELYDTIDIISENINQKHNENVFLQEKVNDLDFLLKSNYDTI